MPDDNLAKFRPGAFQHPSFGVKDGWFVVIQALSLLLAVLVGFGLLSPLSRLVDSGRLGDGLSRLSAGGVVALGIWCYDLTSFRRWAIAALPVVTFMFLLLGMTVVAATLLQTPPILGDASPIDRVDQVCGGVAALLATIILWRMSGREFREYNRAAWGMPERTGGDSELNR